ncbi:MAG TPA: peptidoglycan DD-metalloendopeptidase family protein [Blastocatellia bacterium]|jgi:murein DD-endopeptidase MepM/ murein hydrolase activator NlpD
MWLTIKHAIIIVAAFALLVLVFRLGIYVRRIAESTSPVPTEANSSPRASPEIGSPPITPSRPAPPVGQETPEDRDLARPAETPVLSKPETLTIPVAGIRPEQLRDTYSEARSEGRTHNALDIMANCGTPTVAATAGKIIKLFQSKRGGITIYQLGADNRTVYYYAHLARYADGLTEGRIAQQGEVIGYVGDTGNVAPGGCHLHFAIWIVTDPKRYWNGENINPYPLLRS